jgi:hypothetical protein
VNGTVADVTTTKKDGSYTFKVEPGTTDCFNLH